MYDALEFCEIDGRQKNGIKTSGTGNQREYQNQFVTIGEYYY